MAIPSLIDVFPIFICHVIFTLTITDRKITCPDYLLTCMNNSSRNLKETSERDTNCGLTDADQKYEQTKRRQELGKNNKK